ncbi:MAG: transporter substrate-binding domain-containing protein [Lachnospiraceae bacterium]|nr:transporter substrate-binding domain-containing protein [Lachnospiraceae bacterium]
MKRIITLLLTLSVVFCFAGCTNPLKKSSDTENEQKKEEITAVHTKDSMKGITLKVGVSPDFAPFTYKDEKTGEMEGFDIDYLDAVSEYLGFDYVLVVEQMKDLESDLEKGQIDCAISGISITDERLEKFKFTDSYFSNSLTLVKNKDVEAESRKDIVHMKLGVEKGTAADEYLQKYLKKFNNKIKNYNNTTKVFKELEKGNIQATIFDATGVDYYLNHHPDTNIEIVETNLNEEQSNYGIMCTKEFRYIDEFNVGMKQIELAGSYQELYNKWFKANTED